MREDFVALILTHGRPDKVHTLNSLKRAGYSGKWALVVDDEDPTRQDYIKQFGRERVVLFNKDEIARSFDLCDNGGSRKVIVFARNACWSIARRLGCRFFIQLDDDYSGYGYRTIAMRPDDVQPVLLEWPVRNIGNIFEALVAFLESTPALTIAIAQGGDLIGGAANPRAQTIQLHRKAMNSFVCDVEKPFSFVGRINEDVNTYTSVGRKGGLFFSYMMVQLHQKTTQANSGGMTDTYVDGGTYLKSFYSVMLTPSAVRVGMLSTQHQRIHHKVQWNACAPKLLRQQHQRFEAAHSAT